MRSLFKKYKPYIDKAVKVASLAYVAVMLSAAAEMELTAAMYSDKEISPGNAFLAGDLMFSLNIDQDFNNANCNPHPEQKIILTNESNALRYKIEENGFSGELCDFVNLEISRPNAAAAPECFGPLAGLHCGPFETAASTTEEWVVKVNYLQGAPIQKHCDFSLKFNGWQARHMPIFGGYHWEQEVMGHLDTDSCVPKLIINKVYPAPDCAHSEDCFSGAPQNEWKNEWIEIYNSSSESISLKNWEICNRNVCQKILEDKILAPEKYAVVSHRAATWNFWEIPAEVVKISQLSGDSWELEMDNAADMLQLKDPAGVLTDQMNWGVPSAIWPNYNAGLWNPGVVPAPQGSFLWRTPDHYDTDQPTDWANYLPPTIAITGLGFANPWNYTWYYNKTYPITWTAINPNGSNGDLLIDLIYYKDTNTNGRLDAADARVVIAAGLPNTGRYDLHITGPFHYYGYVWVKAIARDLNNFMVQATTMSARIFEPDNEDDVPPEIIDDEETLNLETQDGQTSNGEISGGQAAPAIIEEDQLASEILLLGDEEVQTQEPPTTETDEMESDESDNEEMESGEMSDEDISDEELSNEEPLNEEASLTTEPAPEVQPTDEPAFEPLPEQEPAPVPAPEPAGE